MAAEYQHQTKRQVSLKNTFRNSLFLFSLIVLLSSCGGMLRKHNDVGFGGGWGLKNLSETDSTSAAKPKFANFYRAKALCEAKVQQLKVRAEEFIYSDSTAKSKKHPK